MSNVTQSRKSSVMISNYNYRTVFKGTPSWFLHVTAAAAAAAVILLRRSLTPLSHLILILYMYIMPYILGWTLCLCPPDNGCVLDDGGDSHGSYGASTGGPHALAGNS